MKKTKLLGSVGTALIAGPLAVASLRQPHQPQPTRG